MPFLSLYERVWFFRRTKQLLVDVVQCVEGDTIHKLPTGPTLPHQERAYQAIVATRAHHEQKANMNETGLNHSFATDSRWATEDSLSSIPKSGPLWSSWTRVVGKDGGREVNYYTKLSWGWRTHVIGKEEKNVGVE